MEDVSISAWNPSCPCNDDAIFARNSVIEEIRIDRNTGFVTISYGVMGDFNMVHMELVTLIVTRETRIQDQSRRNLSLGDLREGMIVDAEFSSAMTMSIPPQSRAFRITVVNRNMTSNVTVGRVLWVDLRNRFLYTGNVTNQSSQIRFVITNNTAIFDSNGNRILLGNIRPGQRVSVEHANFQTQSIPPQTTAFQVQVI